MLLDIEGKKADFEFLENGNLKLSFEIDKSNRFRLFQGLSKLKDLDLDIKVDKHRKKRSLDANKYFWLLCTKLSDVLNTPKEDIYRSYIKAVGDYTPLPIKEKAVEEFKRKWGSKGEGWFAEVIDDSKLPGYKLVFAYYGSSTYDTKRMSRIIDMAVQDCKDQGIETLTPDQLKEMMSAWERKVFCKAKKSTAI